MSRGQRFGLSIVLVLLLLYVAIGWYFSGLIVSPGRRTLEGSMAWLEERNGAPYEEQMAQYGEPQPFSVVGARDVSIEGWFFDNSADCAVVIAHGWNSNRLGSQKFMDLFWDRGCDIAIYDHRGHGESGGEYGTGGNLEKLDLITVTEWVSAETGLPMSSIGWHGTSWGASAALQAAALESDVAFAIADSSFKDWESAISERAVRQYGSPVRIFTVAAMSFAGMRSGTNYRDGSPYKVASQIELPVMLIHSQTDTQTESWQSADIFTQLDPDNSVFHHTDWGAEHARDIDERPEAYRALVYEFIDTYASGFGVTP